MIAKGLKAAENCTQSNPLLAENGVFSLSFFFLPFCFCFCFGFFLF